MNMVLPMACVSKCVPCAVIQFSTARNKRADEIHKQLTEVYGVQMVRKRCRKFREGQCEVHESRAQIIRKW